MTPQERKHLATVLKQIHGAMVPRRIKMDKPSPLFTLHWGGVIAISLFMWLLIFCLFSKFSHAYTDDQLANAIYKAENSKTHPYGILIKYKRTSPRQACLNTIRHKRRDYSKLSLQTRQSKRFLAYLAEHYAPIGAQNDPTGLNRNWIRNIEHFLALEVK